MKLKEGVFLHKSGDEYMAVTQGKAAQSFNGLIRSNKTANDIMILLKSDTTEEEIISAMIEKYDAPKDIIEKDVKNIIIKLRETGIIDE